MNEIQKLIEVTENLCKTLDTICENERRFGFDICHKLELMSYEAYKINCELSEIGDHVRGVA